jgi:photosystem II stability/assembly factor-like uncharacterized protein
MPTKHILPFLIMLAIMAVACRFIPQPEPAALPTLPALPALAMPTAAPTQAPVATLPPTMPPPQESSPTAVVISAPDATPTNMLAPHPEGQVLPRAKAGEEIRVKVLRMFSQTGGWALGTVKSDANDHILVTSDGANTFTDRTPPDIFPQGDQGPRTAAAFFMDANHAWVVYSSQWLNSYYTSVWRTADGGQTWQESQPLDNVDAVEFFSPAFITFVDAQHGWLLERSGPAGMMKQYFFLYTTGDGGQTWQQVINPHMDTPLPMTCSLTGMLFWDQNNGWLTGNCNGLYSPDLIHLFATTDGGRTWNNAAPPPPADLTDFAPAGSFSYCGIEAPTLMADGSRKVIYACRVDQKERRWLYTNSADGSTWQPLPLPDTPGSLFFLPSGTGWFVGQGHIYQTVDRGKTWNSIFKMVWLGTADFIDPQTGWIIAVNGEESALVYTTNGGSKFLMIKPVIK